MAVPGGWYDPLCPASLHDCRHVRALLPAKRAAVPQQQDLPRPAALESAGSVALPRVQRAASHLRAAHQSVRRSRQPLHIPLPQPVPGNLSPLRDLHLRSLHRHAADHQHSQRRRVAVYSRGRT